jgi:hypothetical protein
MAGGQKKKKTTAERLGEEFKVGEAEAERTLRGAAEARKTGRTSKTEVGARRQTILVTVLQSLRLYLPHFTLAAVLEEMTVGGKRAKVASPSCSKKGSCNHTPNPTDAQGPAKGQPVQRMTNRLPA